MGKVNNSAKKRNLSVTGNQSKITSFFTLKSANSGSSPDKENDALGSVQNHPQHFGDGKNSASPSGNDVILRKTITRNTSSRNKLKRLGDPNELPSRKESPKQSSKLLSRKLFGTDMVNLRCDRLHTQNAPHMLPGPGLCSIDPCEVKPAVSSYLPKTAISQQQSIVEFSEDSLDGFCSADLGDHLDIGFGQPPDISDEFYLLMSPHRSEVPNLIQSGFLQFSVVSKPRLIGIDLVMQAKDTGVRGYPVVCKKDAVTYGIFHVTLRGTWAASEICLGSVMNVVGVPQFSPPKSILVDNNDMCYVVVNPEHLVPCTTVINGIRCLRRAVLSTVFKDFKANTAMICGTILHEVFSKTLSSGGDASTNVSRLIEEQFQSVKVLNDVYSLNLSLQEVKEEVLSYTDSIVTWINAHMSKGKAFTINNVEDIEENFWSPRLGLKGKIDVTLNVTRKGTCNQDTIPLELKSGRMSNTIEHRSQTALYTMLFGDRRLSPDYGYILYMRNGEVVHVPVKHLDRRELLHIRNNIAFFGTFDMCGDEHIGFKTNVKLLPEMIGDQFVCKRCPQLRNCSMMMRATEERLPQELSEDYIALVTGAISHIDAEACYFFTQCYIFCHLESDACQKKNLNRIWRFREDVLSDVNCLAQLTYVSAVQTNSEFSNKFRIQNSSDWFMAGDRVVISSATSIALCTGTVENLANDFILVLCDKDCAQYSSEAFVLHKYEYNTAMQSQFCALSDLYADNTRATKIRNAVIGDSAPRFHVSVTTAQLIPSESVVDVKRILEPLNAGQRRAIKKCLTARDFAIVGGMPGTGKTTFISSLVQVFSACKKSVLITSYTNSAVDNVLVKLECAGVNFLRLGSAEKVHSDISRFTVPTISSLEELTAVYDNQIVAATLLGLGHTLFKRRVFDVCIVDEASQAPLLLCVKAALLSNVFILVGDDKQLPPLIISRKAQDLLLESLFTRLARLYPSSSVDLIFQYRMNEEIMNLSNRLTYDMSLKCGNPAVASQRLCYDRPHDVDAHKQWLTDCTDAARPVCLVDTSNVGLHETRLDGGEIHNSGEALLVSQIVDVFVSLGVPTESIGIIAPYRGQLKELKRAVSHDVEICTVDRYQGRDKPLILISFVRSSCENINLTGQLLSDERRLNVALTRSKAKLVMVGDLRTIRKYPPIAMLIDILRDGDGQIIDYFQ